MAPAAGEESGDPGRRKACVVVLGDLGWNRCLYRERLSDISILRCRRDPSISFGNAVKCQSVNVPGPQTKRRPEKGGKLNTSQAGSVAASRAAVGQFLSISREEFILRTR